MNKNDICVIRLFRRGSGKFCKRDDGKRMEYFNSEVQNGECIVILRRYTGSNKPIDHTALRRI